MGGKLATTWKFPHSVVDAIEHCENPDAAAKSPQYARLIHLSRIINEHWDLFVSEQEKFNFMTK
ncbi:hypothetical protein [Vibrio spartinae]|uniref:hypothetical protein n=1 Tax=Vibrio spartinae TaxID=1918945 RepID=UPI00111517FC|nr:hypothetical protein [Vibrio spartinae]